MATKYYISNNIRFIQGYGNLMETPCSATHMKQTAANEYVSIHPDHVVMKYGNAKKKKNNNYVVSTKQMYLGNDGNIVTDRRAARSFNTIVEAFATLDLINDIKDKFGEVFVIDAEFKKKNRPTPVPENPAKEVVKRIQFSPSVRHKVYEKSNVCCICGKPIDEIGFSIDHKIPLSRGGSNDLENLQPVCPECNRLKGNYTNEEMHNAIGGIYCNNLYKWSFTSNF